MSPKLLARPHRLDGIIHLGKTWRDMPGVTRDDKAMNFSLFRRGKLTLDYINSNPKTRAQMNVLGGHQGGF